MITAISLLLAQAPSAYGSFTATGPATFDFQPNARNLVAIEVKLNGKGPYLMGIDTCASGGVRLSTKICEDLGLPKVGEVQSGDGTGQNMRSIPVRRASSLEVGGITFRDVEVFDRTSPVPPGPAAPGASARQVDGILGFGLFRELLLKIDFPAKKVTISMGSLKADSSTVNLERAEVSTVTLEIGQHKRKAHFDTGADGGLVMPESESKELNMKEPLRLMGRLKTNFNDIEIKGAPFDGQVKLGVLKLDNPIIAFASIFRNVNFGRRLMQGHAFTFDCKNELMKIE